MSGAELVVKAEHHSSIQEGGYWKELALKKKKKEGKKKNGTNAKIYLYKDKIMILILCC